ncbi:MAG: aspartate aminotransferase family protein [Candidatus Eisenbacteria bacterium]
MIDRARPLARPPAALRTFPAREEVEEVLRLVAEEASSYLARLDAQPVLSPAAGSALAGFRHPLPEEGIGAVAALRQLIEEGSPAVANTSGPRCFHFVIGGATPAAIGADWLASSMDQMAYTWVTSPLAVELELLSLSWLKELFGLPAGWSGVMTTGASMANFVGLAAARQWWGERYGADISERGLTGLPQLPVFASGYLHASDRRCLALLGIGRQSVRICSSDATGRIDLDAVEAGLRSLDGEPAVLIAIAGEVNAGEFDPIEEMADLAHRYGAWLHVDGAFGLFAALSDRVRERVRGVDRADSVTVDGHKWLNVPYDCGFSFVRDAELLAKSFAYTADYLPKPDDPHPTMGAVGPESSRRARSLAVWATLRAYGKAGHRAIVERHLDLAQHLARRVDEAPDLERLADVPLNIVCFRYRPAGRALADAALDRLNARLGEAILRDGRVLVGTTRYAGRTAFRPAIANWRTGPEDVDLLVSIVREFGEPLAREIS